MADDQSSDVKLEIGHVLFIDIVGYSKLLITEQSERLQKLKEIVWGTEQFRQAQADGKLLRLPTGDGGALVFRNHLEAPVLCAMEISKELKSHPDLQVRMGIHSGPVNEITDLNAQANIAGAGINVAQRIMDCGDAGHILVSQHVADDLEQYPRWRSLLHDLGECEVKHGVRVHAVNLYTDELGNAEVPEKFRQLDQKKIEKTPAAAAPKETTRFPWHEIVMALLLVAAVVAGAYLWFHRVEHPAPTPRQSEAATISEKSIAVLPFDNLSEEKANAFFTDGVQDEILTHLAKIADLKVISRTSVMQYKTGVARNLRKIAEELNVAHVVEGSVQRASNKVRVNVQLIDARNDHHEWAENYDRPIDDVFAIQSEIAKAIADQLQAKLSPAEKTAVEQRPTADVPAFDLYSRAKTIILTTSQGTTAAKTFLQAIELLNAAVTRDRSFYTAFCQLVFAHDQLYSTYDEHTPERLAAAETALQRVAELRPNAAETHLVRGTHLYRAFRDYKGALSELEAARAGLPNDPRIPEFTGYIAYRQGRVEEGLHALEQAVKRDPRNPYILSQLSVRYLYLGRYADERAMLQRVLEIAPDDVGAASNLAFDDFLWRGDTTSFRLFIERLRAERPQAVVDAADNWFACALAERDWSAAEEALTALGDNPCVTDSTIQLSRQFGEGILARAMGDEGRARNAFTTARLAQEQVVQKQKDYGPALSVLGLIDAALGNKQAALQEGRRAMELLPVEKDLITGQAVIAYFAMTAAWVGEKDLALQHLPTVVRTPGGGFITSYGMLKLLPFWDPLRGDPHFEQIVASLAPKGDTR